MKINRKFFGIVLVILFCVVTIYLFVKEWDSFFQLIKIVFYSVILGYILTPLCSLLEKLVPRPYAVLLLYLFVGGLLALFFILFIPILWKEILSLNEYLPNLSRRVHEFTDEAQKWFRKIGMPEGLRFQIEQYLDGIQRDFFDFIGKIFERMVNGAIRITELFIVPVLSFYFIKDRDYFKKIMTELIPIKWRKDVFKTLRKIHLILNQFIRGELIIVAIVSILATIGFLIIQLPYAVILGIGCGIFEFIPYAGPWLGAIPAVLIAFLNSPSKALWTIITVLIVQQLEGNFITPKIMSTQVELHPVFIILSLWIGGSLFGIMGMFLAVPTVLILRVSLKDLYLKIVSIM